MTMAIILHLMYTMIMLTTCMSTGSVYHIGWILKTLYTYFKKETYYPTLTKIYIRKSRCGTQGEVVQPVWKGRNDQLPVLVSMSKYKEEQLDYISPW